MEVDPFKCPKCGSRMLNYPTRHGYTCPVCVNHEPFGHLNARAGRNVGVAGKAARRASQAGNRSSGACTAGRPKAGGHSTAISRFELPALERLAKVIADAYTGTQITDLFRKAGLGTIRHDGSTKWRFLYAEFERIQERFGSPSIAKVLMAACDPRERLNGRDIRKEVNECLAPSSLDIREDGKMIRVEKTGAPPSPNAGIFDQRNFHPTVIEHARQKFLKGEHFSATVECCKMIERTVQEKSGLDDYGASLMSKALGENGRLELDLPGVAGKTKKSMQRGLMQECQGILSSVRNPMSHEPEMLLSMGRESALEILSTISRLFKLLEKTRLKPSAELHDAQTRKDNTKALPLKGYGAEDFVIRGVVCLAGHVFKAMFLPHKNFDDPCPECGLEVFAACPNCDLGVDQGGDERTVVLSANCPGCGAPYPWDAETAHAIRVRNW